MACNNNYNCFCCGCYNECDDEHKQVEVEAMTKEDVLTLWEIIKSKFALLIHKHSAGDIDSGVLSVANGGTGADNGSDALENLGAAPEEHTHGFDDIEFTSEDILDIEHGGTGLSQNPMSLTDLASNNEDEILKLHSTPGVTGVLREEHGGTGANTFDGARTNLHVPGTWDGTNAVVSLAEGGLGVSCDDEAEARAAIHAAAENHTHSADDINEGILGIGHGGTGANTATEARENLGAAAVDHTHYTMATAKQHHEADPDSDNQVLNGAGYISFNEYIAAAPNTILKRDPASGSTFNAIKIPTAGNYLVSAQLNYKPTSNVNVAVAIMRVREGAELRIARAMNLCSSSENTALAIPMQFVTDLEAGDLIKLYVSAAGKVVTQSGAALTVMYFDSGVIVDA